MPVDKFGTETAETVPGPARKEDYAVVSIAPSGSPRDMPGTDWHCYVITQGDNTIRGYRQGKIDSVTTFVAELVERLNERRLGKRYTPPPAMTPRTRSGSAE
jgi:hypothetical protein